MRFSSAPPGEDEFIRRQAANGLQPILELSQSRIGWKPNRRDRAARDGIVVVGDTAGRIIGAIVHRGISIASSTVLGGITVDADRRDARLVVESDALGEGSPVHEALLEGQGRNPLAGRSTGVRRGGAGEGLPLRRSPRHSPSVDLEGSSLLLGGGQGGELLLPPVLPLLLGDDMVRVEAPGTSKQAGNLKRNLAVNAHPALAVGPERGELAVSSGGGEMGPGGSTTRAGTALNRALTRGARTTARAAMGVDTSTAGLLRTAGAQGKTTKPGAAGRGARRHRSCRTYGIPGVARRNRTVDHTEITRGARSVGDGPSTSAAT